MDTTPVRNRGKIHIRVTPNGHIRHCVKWSDERRASYFKSFPSRAQAEAFRLTLPYLRGRTLVARVTNRVTIDPTTGCWVASGSIASNGYPHVGVSKNVKISTHRAMFEAWWGPIPDGMVLDHLCRNTRCCNPEHLEPVTDAENVARGNAPSAKARRDNRCLRGHEFTEESTYHYANGKRTCRTCRDARARERRAEKRLLKAS